MRSLSAIALCAAATLALAPQAGAAMRPCLDGSAERCHVLPGKVVSVGDGDTIDVDVAGDGTGRNWHVRLTGIQAMELTRYSSTAGLRRGACHAREATRRMERLVLHRRVRLLSQRLESFGSGRRHRARRALQVRKSGRWIDPTAVLIREGHALWDPNAHEWAWNRHYRELAQGAASRGRRMYNPSYCGRGPGPARALAMSLRWDAEGRDGVNVSGEFARVENTSGRTMRLGGWRFRDSALRSYRLPRGARLRPGAALRIHVGNGTRRPGHLFWGLRAPIFENPSHDRRATGDGAYLFDPQGDLRAHVIYPCAERCPQPGGDPRPRDGDNGGGGDDDRGDGGPPPWAGGGKKEHG
jgi:endonuclease YncB( thermonuclease family)